MPLVAKASDGKPFTPAPEGLHPALCWAVVDLGIQEKGGMYPGEQHQVYLGFDLLDTSIEFEKDGKAQTGPMRVGVTLTLSLGEKAKLRKWLERWRGKEFTADELKGFDISKLVGLPCNVLVTHTTKGEKTHANVESILKWTPGVAHPAPAKETLYFSLEDHTLEQVRKHIPEWLQERIEKRLADNWEQFNEKRRGPVAPDVNTDVDRTAPYHDPNFDDSIPF